MSVKQDEIRSVDLMITNQCNLKCQYCYHKQKNEVMDLDGGRAILRRLKEISPTSMNIIFFGGEPMLESKLILDLAEYAKSLWPDSAKFTLCTNGTIFNEETFLRLKQYKFSIQLSIDGGPEVMRLQRTENPEVIYENAIKIRNIFPDVSVRMTYTPKTVGMLAHNVRYIAEMLGIRRITHHATMEDDWTDEALTIYQSQLRAIYHYRRFLKRKDIPVHIMFVDKNLEILNDDSMPTESFCEAGKSYIAIMPNGDVHPCHRAASNSIFKLGNIHDKDLPFIRGMFLALSKHTMGCGNCSAVSTCHNCVIANYLVNGFLQRPTQKHCGICKIEDTEARVYLQTERTDKLDKLLNKMAVVLADVSERLNEVEESKDAAGI